MQIVGNSPEAINFLEYALTLPFIREERAEKQDASERIPGLAYSHRERLADLRQAKESYDAGRYISHEEMGKHIDGLK